jgi:DAK2 domain fusion protein YloV
MTLERLGADDLRHVIVAFRDALRQHQTAVNRLNVYPVPDGDTGSNMALTLASVVAELDEADTDLESTCKAISHGSLMGARGNSGVILSQILRGFADVVRASDGGIDGRVVADGLAAASEGAYGAVMRPVEGTILTVVRETADAAATAVADGADLLGVLEAARTGGQASLERTPELLSVLADAGVVDAGGAGFLLLLDAALLVVDGRPLPEPPEVDELEEALAAAHGAGGGHDHGAGGIADLRYEVMYFLEAPDETIPWFKDVWAGIGDSIVVVGGDGIWNCHIHTDDIGASIEAALDCGRPRDIRITDLLEQVEEEKWVREGSDGAPVEESPLALTPATTAVVAVSVGDGIRRIFHSLGVQQIVSGGQSMNPSTKQLLEAVEACPSDCVIILPNNKNIIPVAEQVDAHTVKTVRVVPTRGISEGFAALVAYDPEADLEANAAALAESAEAVTAGEITRAVRDSSCDLGPIAEGDWLGISRSGIDAIEKTLSDAATTLLAKLLDDSHEIITLIEGEGSSVADTRRITQWLADNHPDVTAEVHSGGQPLYPYFIGIE